MTAGPDPGIENGPDDFQIIVQGFPSFFVQLQKDVVIGNGGQYPRFLQPGLFDEGDVLLGRPDPSRNFGKAKPQILASLHRFLVLIAVQEKLRLADDPVLAPQTAHHHKEIDDLLNGVRRSSLLAVTEGRVGDENFIRRLEGKHPVIKVDPADFIVREDFLL
ncbi:MAG: hypothetical protein A4E72_01455 [Syntrophus sp. PtaU1.Bin208]|nr:MAG: hypothetical protein A4E72_01455 [Syntrophus sp. PtaU1.Bin208]